MRNMFCDLIGKFKVKNKELLDTDYIEIDYWQSNYHLSGENKGKGNIRYISSLSGNEINEWLEYKYILQILGRI